MRLLGTVMVFMSCGLAFSGCGDDATVTPRDGAAADAPLDGGERDGGDPAGPCADVSTSPLTPVYDLEVVGTGFDAWDGEVIRVAVAHNPPLPFGVADVEVAGGAFSLRLAATAVSYDAIGIYVDGDRSDTCDADEPAWGTVAPVVSRDYLLEVTPTELCDYNGCRSWASAPGECTVNATLDLSAPLPCPRDDPYPECDVDAGLEDNPGCPVAGSRCSPYRGCEPPCSGSGVGTRGCPPPTSSFAVPTCNFGSCFLSCRPDGEAPCPTGMTCETDVCVWNAP